MPTPPHRPFVGRREEISRLRDLFAAAERGDGGVLVLRGEPGIGKSALLEHAAQVAASTFRTIRGSGAEFERELPFAGLHQLCVPLLTRLDELSPLHRGVLQVAFGLEAGRPDPPRVGLAVLELFAVAARERPLLCVVDDAHWLDDASTRALVFLARRVAAEPIALVFTARDHDPAPRLDELPGLKVAGLSDADARSLLAAERTVTLDQRVRDHVLAEARGNPLALRELPKAGGFAPPTPSPVMKRIQRSFQTRLAELPAPARSLLVLASADPTGDPRLLWAAAQRLGIDDQGASRAAEASELVEFGSRVRFCHPLARSATYWAATLDQRHAVHRALADATDPDTAPDRRAWHRAQASSGTDEDVAADLESAATRALARGGVGAAAAFLERAAVLTRDPGRRTERTLAAVRAALDAGATDAATELLNSVDTEALDDRRHATVDVLRGKIALVEGGGEAENGPMSILRAAQRLAPQDPETSRSYFVAALETALAVGRASGVMGRVIQAARSAPSASRPPDLLDGLVLLDAGRYSEGVPALHRILAGDEGDWTRTPGLATVLAAELWDHDVHTNITEWLVRTGRDTGSPITTRLGLSQVAMAAVLTGDFGRAMEAIAEEEAIADALGDVPQMYPRVQLAAMRGRSADASDLFTEAVRQGTGQLVANVHLATAVLNNGLGDYTAAMDAAGRATGAGDLFLAGAALPELVEAAMRCGEETVAGFALDSLLERTGPVDTTWARGVVAGTRALVTGAEDDHREAVRLLERSPCVPGLARSHLRYGEWLRREGRRRDAREQLRTAHRLLAGIGMEAFAQRAANELRATGEVAVSRSERPSAHLTMQEIHVARHVAAGATSKEVAARLFLSPRTIDAHLRNIFGKLGITSRRQLRDMADFAR